MYLHFNFYSSYGLIAESASFCCKLSLTRNVKWPSYPPIEVRWPLEGWEGPDLDLLSPDLTPKGLWSDGEGDRERSVGGGKPNTTLLGWPSTDKSLLAKTSRSSVHTAMSVSKRRGERWRHIKLGSHNRTTSATLSGWEEALKNVHSGSTRPMVLSEDLLGQGVLLVGCQMDEATSVFKNEFLYNFTHSFAFYMKILSINTTHLI